MVRDPHCDDEHGVRPMSATLAQCGEVMVNLPAVAVLLRDEEEGHIVDCSTEREIVGATSVRPDAHSDEASAWMSTDILAIPETGRSTMSCA